MTSVYRPWGPLEWVVRKLPGEPWGLIGVLGIEDRCIATVAALAGDLRARRFLKILDPYLSPPAAFKDRFAEMQGRLLAGGTNVAEIREVELLHDIDTMLDELDLFLVVAGPRVVLDITSMPKRWFFPLVRGLMNNASVKTLVVTYTSAQAYANQLSSDPAAVAPLPTFDEPRVSAHYDELVVGVGFAPLGLKDLFSADISKIRYLFPFPPGPPNFFRNWHFLRALEAEVENPHRRAEDRWLMDMYDVSGAFEALCRITQNGDHTAALAPFGPKTLSLAMCLFALAAEKAGKEPVHVYYTQPRRYAIDYTTGIKLANGVPDIAAYCLRINGRDVYQI